MKGETASQLRQCKYSLARRERGKLIHLERLRGCVFWLSQWGVWLVLYFQSVVWIAGLRTHLTAIMRNSQCCVCQQTELRALWVLREGWKIKVRKTDEKRNKNPWSSCPPFLLFYSFSFACANMLLPSPCPPAFPPFQLPSLSRFFLLIFLPTETQNPCNPPDPSLSTEQGRRHEQETEILQGVGEAEGKVNERNVRNKGAKSGRAQNHNSTKHYYLHLWRLWCGFTVHLFV